MNASEDVTTELNGIASTQKTLARYSSELGEVKTPPTMREYVKAATGVDTVQMDLFYDTWADRLKNKYGIAQPFADEELA